jgi:hypothetical protein
MWTPLSIFFAHVMFKFAVQEVFKCHKATNSRDHIGLLFLSRHLKKYRYGLEYASLEVKNHLERVNFSDLVETIMIMLVHLNIVFPVI